MKRAIILGTLGLLIALGTIAGIDVLTPAPVGVNAVQALSQWLTGQ